MSPVAAWPLFWQITLLCGVMVALGVAGWYVSLWIADAIEEWDH